MMSSVLRALSCNAISECNNASHVTLHNTFYFLDIDKQVSFITEPDTKYLQTLHFG